MENINGKYYYIIIYVTYINYIHDNSIFYHIDFSSNLKHKYFIIWSSFISFFVNFKLKIPYIEFNAFIILIKIGIYSFEFNSFIWQNI